MSYIESMTGRPMKKRVKYEPRLYRLDYRYSPVRVVGSIAGFGTTFEADPTRERIEGQLEVTLNPARQWDGVNEMLPAKRGYHLYVLEIRCLECDVVAWSWDASLALSLVGHERKVHGERVTS